MSNSSTGKLRIVLIHIHGLFRSKELELGHDADTGGQTKYVLELAEALSESPLVEEVIVLTRQIFDPKVSEDYSFPEEKINDKAKIVRIQCGPRRYLRKEALWPYLYTFIDRSLNYFRRIGKLPHLFHGHYADGGYVASELGRLLLVPTIFTGHSLGRVKQERLIDKGRSKGKIEEQYRFLNRVESEEVVLDTASVVITSTLQEVEEQYSLYDQYQPGNMEVIPPGVNLNSFSPPINGKSVKSPIIDEISKFLVEPKKSAILAIARPDERKNITNLIRAYGDSKDLQEKANLIIIAGTRDKIDDLPTSQRKELYRYLSVIDEYNLYGKVAYPKTHSFDEVPLIYRWASETHGVFVNPALTEPFGLTLLESAASGLPIVATNDGGPRDIIATCQNGLLVDPYSVEDITKALLRILSDRDLWDKFSKSGIIKSKENYSWYKHTEKYIKVVDDLISGNQPRRYAIPKPKKALPHVDRLIITDVDNCLTGNDEALGRFIELVNNLPDHIGFGIATGRPKDSALKLLDELGVPRPNLLITSVGTEIYYGEDLVSDRSWRQQIFTKSWNREKIKDILEDVPGLYMQDEEFQAEFKISYKLDTEKAPKVGEIRKILREHRIKVKVILSLGIYLDIIPIKAGDGLAIRQLSFRWGIPWENILFAGDSGNDEAMLKGETLGVVVSNYSPELERLKKYPRVYFANSSNADGVIEGIHYYNFLDIIEIPNDYTIK